jgi:phosphopantothenoylcysteine decarboxylase/phosphopantothenate--cysteine ligase
MGYAIAEAAVKRGAQVTLISGPTNIKPPMFAQVINVKSASDMYDAVISRMDDCDIIIKAAAVADYTPAQVSDQKVKKKDGELSIALVRTKDILKAVGERKRENQVVCGFSMETENLIENSKKKLLAKNCDMIAANNLKDDGAGFGVDTNRVSIITKDDVLDLGILSKKQVGNEILSHALDIYRQKNGDR